MEAVRMTRGSFLRAGVATAAAGLFIMDMRHASNATDTTIPAHFEVEHTDAEWRKLLTPEQYAVLRQAATETAFSSPLETEWHAGVYDCAGCDNPLFASKTKFDSGTGWPSFYAPLPNAVLERPDHSLMMDRTEVLCHRCGGHLGHVF